MVLFSLSQGWNDFNGASFNTWVSEMTLSLCKSLVRSVLCHFPWFTDYGLFFAHTYYLFNFYTTPLHPVWYPEVGRMLRMELDEPNAMNKTVSTLRSSSFLILSFITYMYL